MGNLLQNHEGSSTSHITPHAFKGKQKQIGQGGRREVFTHFVSLPLATYPELQKKLEAFQNSILGNNNDKVLPLKFENTLAQMGIEKSIFVLPKTFHLTVVMLKLENNESVLKAQNILKSISPNVRQALKNRPVFIRLMGLECMNGSFDKTRVLYAPVEEVGHEGRLLSAVIIDAYLNAGFAGKDAKSRLKESFSILSYRVSEKIVMDGFKKQKKMVNLVWRPITTQSSSVIAEAGNEVSEEVIEGGRSEITSVVSAGKHSVSLEVGASLIKFIRGKEGTTQMKLEEELGVNIILPSSRNEDHIIIEGGSVDCVTKASERIETIIDEVVQSPSLDYSHFVSLPLAIHPELVERLVSFQNSILGNNSIAGDEQDDQADRSTTSVAVDIKANSEKNQVNVDIKSIPIVSYPPKAKAKSSTVSDLGIEKSIFIKPNTFHLTVLMLKLWNKDRVNAARDVMKSISPSVMDALDNRPIFIRLKGLDCMRGPLAKARVLYVPVEEIGDEGRLLRACQVITDAFVKAGLVLEKDAKQSLKLHATVMNARHRKRRKDNRKRMETFDAREIHKQFGNEDWGEYLILEANLSQRFVFDQNGYYRCCASIPFPGEHRA